MNEILTLASTQARKLTFDDAEDDLRNPAARPTCRPSVVPTDMQAVAVAPSDSLALVPFGVASDAPSDSLALVPFDEGVVLAGRAGPPATPPHGQRPDSASHSRFGFKVALSPYTLHTEP